MKNSRKRPAGANRAHPSVYGCKMIITVKDIYVSEVC